MYFIMYQSTELIKRLGGITIEDTIFDIRFHFSIKFIPE